MSILGIIFPSIFGMFIIEKLDKNWELKIKDYIYLGSMLILFSNCIAIVLSKIFWNISSSIINYINLYPIFFVKYVLISIIINFVLSIIFVLIKKYVNIYIEVENSEKN